ncbi:tyrosine-type recombinase/integrase [Amycolatopsis vastitatis]|uniref:Integrase n=1 Tax=Amycolatopsis vastitatis TaxID=1905142 RepID=A0A229SRT3_9PSEU|nr:integrase [Amycolatopsis vastitatis]OXM61394.1 integrase [Amycolatopsis vastitatis]
MTDTTFDVRIWDVRVKTGRPRKDGKPGKKSYTVRWVVAGKVFPESFANSTLAESFRSKLIVAQRNGEAFRISDGLPVSMARTRNDQTWFSFAQAYVDMKWRRAAAKSRSGNADALATATLALLTGHRGKPDDAVLRRAMTGWAFNTVRRETAKPPAIDAALAWLESNTVAVSRLGDLTTLRGVLDQLALKMDGTAAAAKTVFRKRAVVFNALEYAVERDLLPANRLPEVKWTAPKRVRAIDTRVVVNTTQGPRLLAAVAEQKVMRVPRGSDVPVIVERRSSGPRLVACFATMYYSALRPEEAVMLRDIDLKLPRKGWGELLVSETAPIAGAAWTDTGQRRDRRQLKQRAKGEVRPVPCPPPLTALLQRHLEQYGVVDDGRLFRSMDGGDVAESTLARVWDKARKAALTPEEYRSPLARRPYDLRHACVSTWLAGGVISAQVALWAGHSVAVLHEVYAKVLAGLEEESLGKIARILGLPLDDEDEDEADNG